MEEENKNPPKNIIKILLCVRSSSSSSHLIQTGKIWMAYTHTHKPREKLTTENWKQRWNLCTGCFIGVSLSLFYAPYVFCLPHTKFLLAFFLSTAAFSWHFLLLFYRLSSTLPLFFFAFAHSVQPVLIALRWKRRSRNVWLPIQIKIRLTFFFPVISLTNRWRLQWDYNCLV